MTSSSSAGLTSDHPRIGSIQCTPNMWVVWSENCGYPLKMMTSFMNSPLIARPIFYQKDQISFQPFSFNPDTRFGDKRILKFRFLKLKPIKCWLSLSSQTWSLVMFTLVPNPSLGQRTIPFEPPRLLFDSETSARLVFWSDQNKMYGDIHMSTIFNTSILE